MSTSSANDGLNVQLQTLREGLAVKPEQVEITKLAPVFVPAEFFALGNWPGPHALLEAKGIGLTWLVLLPNQSMRYVDHALAEYWRGKGIDWKSQAVRNLREHISENPGTHEFSRSNGKVYAIALMHEDGIGPSRLLLKDRLVHLFPEGYKVALPEMSCGFAFSSHAAESEVSQIQGLVKRCYEAGTRPLAPDIYLPEELTPVTQV